jgi:ubiquitin C-terminal hydrolase
LQAAVRVAVNLPCSHSMLRTLVCALPQGFGWQVGRLRVVITVEEDAHEFVLKLLADSPALESALRLHLTSYVVCDKCGGHSEHQFFDDNCLSVDVRDSTEDAVHAYFGVERLGHDRWDCTYDCAHCRSKQPAQKHTSLVAPTPQFLLVHAKRFDEFERKIRRSMRVSETINVSSCMEHFEFFEDVITKPSLVSTT